MEYSKYRDVQSIAKETIRDLHSFIKEGVSERDIVIKAEEIMGDKGVLSFWYYDVGAFVHVGKRTTISESGKNYNPTDTLVGHNDIVTVDLSPQMDGYWGDYARTYVVQNGNSIEEDGLEGQFENNSKTGIQVEKMLHKLFMCYVTPEMTFEDVYLHMNDVIKQHSFTNLDFAGNLGHTIEFSKENRRYFELGNKVKLSETNLFTFEPHIRQRDGEYGFKREDVYFFKDGKPCVL